MGDNSKIKIGARVLSENQLKKLLPNNNYIYRTIDVMRSHAFEYKKIQEEFCKKNNSKYTIYLNKEFDRNYNNVFSILGDRGSGKTSALLTIKNKLTVEKIFDIMLPIIIPENMGNASSVLGWTICAFEKVIDEIESVIYDNNDNDTVDERYKFFKNCRRNENNELRRAFKELLKYYTYIQGEYKGIINSNYDGMSDYREKTQKVISAERELLNKFEEFISILIEIKKCLNKKDEEPMIYIFFDDVDLNTERCIEITNMILKYCSNPNIIVFVAGSYSTFLESITIKLLEKDKLLGNTDTEFLQSEKLKKKSALATRKILAKDILKKVLPPAYRFYMPKLSDWDKSQFVYSTKENDENNYYTLVDLISKRILNLDSKSKNNFLYYNDNIIKIYFRIFDENPRGLINIYYFLYNLGDSFCGEDYKENALILKEFLDIIVDSNPKLSDIREEILNIINIKDSLKEIFVNYQYIYELFKNREEGDLESIDKCIDLFVLAHFVENILSVKLEYRNVHGIDTFIEMVNCKNKGEFIPRYEHSKFILAFYSEFKDKLEGLGNKCIDGYRINYFTQTYLEILFNLILSDKGDIEYSDIFKMLTKINRSDSTWVKKIIDTIIECNCDNTENIVRACNELNSKIEIDNFSDEFKIKIQNELKSIKDSIEHENNTDILFLYKFYKSKDFNTFKNIDFKDKSQNSISKLKEILYENYHMLLVKYRSIKEVRYRLPYMIFKSLERMIEKLGNEINGIKVEHNEDIVKELKYFLNEYSEKSEISEIELQELRRIVSNINHGNIFLYSDLNNDIQYILNIISDLREIKYIDKDSEEVEEIKDLIINDILLRSFIYYVENQASDKLKKLKKELLEYNESDILSEVVLEKKNNMKKLWFEDRTHVQ